ncbi:MAG: ERF family protein [Humibacter sp.]
MTTTEIPETAESAFAAALARFQAEVPHIGKDQTANTGSYSYAYADLTDITRTSLPLLAACGFAWTARTAVTEAGFVLLSSLKHSAGWTETCEWPLPDPARANAQQVGSALTYARRYTFTALTGVAPGGEDDDAQATKDRPAADAPPPSPVVAAKNALWEQAQRLGWDIEQLRERYAQDNGGSVLESASVREMRAYAKQLAKESPSGLPLNKDGSVSRSQTSEEERVDAGMMSDDERKAHKELVQDVTGDEKKAERISGGVDPSEDPWANIPVATPGGAA